MKTHFFFPFVLILIVGIFFGCEEEDDTPQPIDPAEKTFNFDFNANVDGWIAGFSDVAVDQEQDVAFVTAHKALPDTFQGKALYHKGLNISDDLFMFFKKQVNGLAPNTTYKVSFSADLVTNYGADCFASNVYLKAGVSKIEPKRIVDSLNGTKYYVMNIDKGNQVNEGDHAILLGEGDVKNELPTCDPNIFGKVTRSDSTKTLSVETDSNGSAWLILATESTFEVAHEMYFTAFEAKFAKVEGQ